MNTKHCVYKNCGNSSSFTKITFFSFPLKDVEKCQHWAEMAGCDGLNLKNKYLCEHHFSSIYISKTPRRTVLLPNAVPYRYDETINKDENYEDDYNSEKNTTREEILLEPLDSVENDIIYSETIEMMRNNDDGVDENVEALDDSLVEEEIQEVNQKIKINPLKAAKITQKPYENTVGVRIKKVEKLVPNRVSLATTDFTNNVTKRQRLHTSADNMTVPDQINDTPKPVERSNVTETDKNDAIDNTIDNPDITTFIYKGEEYIQMPKRIYLEQRAKLDADVKRFQNILNGIKDLVNSTD